MDKHDEDFVFGNVVLDDVLVRVERCMKLLVFRLMHFDLLSNALIQVCIVMPAMQLELCLSYPSFRQILFLGRSSSLCFLVILSFLNVLRSRVFRTRLHLFP